MSSRPKTPSLSSFKPSVPSKLCAAAFAIFCLTQVSSHADANRELVHFETSIVAIQKTGAGGPNALLTDKEQGNNEQVVHLNDGKLQTKFLTRARNGEKPPGVDTGFVVASYAGPSRLTGFKIATGGDLPERDPMTLTIEGSNDPQAVQARTASFTLLYRGSAGLDDDPGRSAWGQTVPVEGADHFRFYRVLITSKRGDSDAVQFSEVQLFGSPEKPDAVMAPPALERFRIGDHWSGRSSITGARQGPGDPLTLWYRQPASIWDEALPIGNGRLGGMIFGGVADERVQLNVDSLWDGYPRDTTHPDALTALPKVRQLLFEGKNNEAEKLAEKSMLGVPRRIHPYQSLGELWMEFEGLPAVADYTRQLDLGSATASVRFTANGTRFHREFFSSAPAGAIVARFQADRRGAISTRMTLKRQKDATCVAHPQDPAAILLLGQVDRRDNAGNPRGVEFAAQVKAFVKGGTVDNTGGILTIKNADSVILVITGATSYPGLREMGELLRWDSSGGTFVPGSPHWLDPKEQCRQATERTLEKTYEVLRQEHIDDYQGYFNRVSLRLGEDRPEIRALPTDERLAAMKRDRIDDPGLLAQYFHFGRYLLISSSRPGSLPANLQGIWTWEMNPPWNSDFHTNINVQMNYWPAEPANLAELHEPLFDLMDSLTSTGKQVAQKHYGAGGWVVHHLTNPFGFATPADFLGGVWPMGAAWLARHPWEHFSYSGDMEFLRDRGWPLMKGAAEFILDFLVEAPAGTPVAGKFVTNPSYSPENHFLLPNGDEAVFTYGATMDLMIIRELLENCVKAGRMLDADPDFLKRCEQALAKLAPVRISPETGRIYEWIEDYRETDPKHRHISHLYGLYPGNSISSATPELMEAARKVLERRGDRGVGWGLAWKIAMWARLHDGDRAAAILRDLLAEFTYPNLFDKCPPFQIDGNFGATAAVVEMLLQTHVPDGKGLWEIHLLPSLPSSWTAGAVSGLRARGGVTVDVEWREGSLERVRLKATRTGNYRVRSRDLAKDIPLRAGEGILLNSHLERP